MSDGRDGIVDAPRDRRPGKQRDPWSRRVDGAPTDEGASRPARPQSRQRMPGEIRAEMPRDGPADPEPQVQQRAGGPDQPIEPDQPDPGGGWDPSQSPEEED